MDSNDASSSTTPRDSLSDYKFSFESYLDYASKIEIDVSLEGVFRPMFGLCLLDTVKPSNTLHIVGLAVLQKVQLLIFRRDTASIAESIYEFHKENGRTYHAYRAGCKFLSQVQARVREMLTSQRTIIPTMRLKLND